MLILTRRPGEKIYIGDDIIITVVEAEGRWIRIGIEAPRHLKIYRESVYLRIQQGEPPPNKAKE